MAAGQTPRAGDTYHQPAAPGHRTGAGEAERDAPDDETERAHAVSEIRGGELFPTSLGWKF